MKVTVEPVTVAGTHRGGEDLFLVFSCDEEFKQGPIEVEPVQGQPSWHYEEESELWWCRTDHCEHKWSGDLQDLNDLALSLGATDLACWEWYGQATEVPKRRFRVKWRACGNAD